MAATKEKRSKVVPIFRVVKNRKGELCLRIAGSSDDLLMSDGWWVKMAKRMESWIDALDHDGYSAEHMEWYEKEKKLLVEAKKIIKKRASAEFDELLAVCTGGKARSGKPTVWMLAKNLK